MKKAKGNDEEDVTVSAPAACQGLLSGVLPLTTRVLHTPPLTRPSLFCRGETKAHAVLRRGVRVQEIRLQLTEGDVEA